MDPWAPPAGVGGLVATGEGSGDLLPDRLRLRGWAAVSRRWIWRRNARLVIVCVGTGALLGWGLYQGSWSHVALAVALAGVGVQVGARQVVYRPRLALLNRMQAVDSQTTTEALEALVADLDEPWRAFLLLSAAGARLNGGDSETADRYLRAVERSGWLLAFPQVGWHLDNLRALMFALRGDLDDADRHHRAARDGAPPEQRPFVGPTDVIVHLRRGRPDLARRAMDDREREIAAQPAASEHHAAAVDDTRAMLTALILTAEGAGADAIDRELRRIRRPTVFDHWGDDWPPVRPLVALLRARP